MYCLGAGLDEGYFVWDWWNNQYLWHLGLLLNQEGSSKGKLSASGKLRPIKQTIYCFLLHKLTQRQCTRIVFSLFIWNFTRFVELETLDFIYEPSSHLSLIWTINSLTPGLSRRRKYFSESRKIFKTAEHNIFSLNVHTKDEECLTQIVYCLARVLGTGQTIAL